MTQSFSTTKLTNHRVLVTGTDHAGASRSAILCSKEFDALNERDRAIAAGEKFDDAVEEFFSALTQAAAEYERAAEGEDDSLTYFIAEEAVEGQAARPEVRINLQHDTIVLRALTIGETERLVWVGDSIEVLAQSEVPAAAPEADEQPAQD